MFLPFIRTLSILRHGEWKALSIFSSLNDEIVHVQRTNCPAHIFQLVFTNFSSIFNRAPLTHTISLKLRYSPLQITLFSLTKSLPSRTIQLIHYPIQVFRLPNFQSVQLFSARTTHFHQICPFMSASSVCLRICEILINIYVY